MCLSTMLTSPMTVEAFLTPPTVALEPGTTATCEVRVRSTDEGPSEFRFRVRGEAARWTTVFPMAVTVTPESDGLARLVLSPPRASHPLAGQVPLEIEVISGSDGTTALVATGTLEVAAVVQISAVLVPPDGPQRGSVPQRHTLRLENLGNTDLNARLRKQDGDELVLEVDPSRLTVSPGQTAEAMVSSRGARTVRAGSEPQGQAFQVLVEPDGGSTVTVEGRVHRERVLPALPAWAAKAAMGVGVVAMVGGLLAAALQWPSNGSAAPPPLSFDPTTTVVDEACLARGHIDGVGNRVHAEARPERLLPFDYSFMRVGAGGCTPARFNPCEPIHYAVNPANAPPGGVSDVREAMAQLARATGMTFVDDGTTNETMPGETRPSYQPQRYGQRWAPILIAWEKVGGGSASQTVGRGGPTDIRNGVILTGYVGLNVDAVVSRETRAALRDGFGTSDGSGPVGPQGVTWGRVLLHELAHLVGLGHAGSPASLMYPLSEQQTTRPARYSAQDLAGLKRLGRDGGCLTTPPPGPSAPTAPAPAGH
jgi:Matrixin